MAETRATASMILRTVETSNLCAASRHYAFVGTSSERFIVLRAQAGDRQALEELLISLQQPLYRYLFRLIGNRDLVEDVLQDVLLLLCRKVGWLRDPDLLRPWAYRIASRAAFRRLRRMRMWREEPLEEAGSVSAPPEAGPFDPELLRHIDRLSAGSRAVLLLHYIEELSLPEVGDVLEIPLGTVKSRLSYGLSQLRRRMGGTA